MPTLLQQVGTIATRLDEHIVTTESWRNEADGRLDRIEEHITRPTRKKAS
jgi:hypothetical protein